MRLNLTKQDDSLSPLTQIKNEIGSIFNGTFGQAPISLFGDGSFSPCVDITEDEKAIYVEAELPGINEKDLEVQLKNNILTIRGERKEENKDNIKRGYRIERQYGSFERSFTLPDEVLEDKVNAKYKKGILRITLPKDQVREAKTIKINLEQ